MSVVDQRTWRSQLDSFRPRNDVMEFIIGDLLVTAQSREMNTLHRLQVL